MSKVQSTARREAPHMVILTMFPQCPSGSKIALATGHPQQTLRASTERHQQSEDFSFLMCDEGEDTAHKICETTGARLLVQSPKEIKTLGPATSSSGQMDITRCDAHAK